MDWKPVQVLDEDGNGFEFMEKGGLVMPSIFPDGDTRLKQIKELPYSTDDVLLCSYPKTGTHWIFNLVHNLLAGGSGEDLASVPPMMMDFIPQPMWENVAKSKLRTSHLKPDRLPNELLKNGGKIILVVRNPKDTCVSFYHHLTSMKSEMKFGDSISWKRFVEAWINGELPYGTYFDYYNDWAKLMAENKNINVLVVHFEKMKQNGLQEMHRIQEFLGLEHSDDQLLNILDKCTVKKMREDVDSGKTFSALVDSNGKSFLYRKGEVGGWKSYFTVAQNELLDKIIENRTKDYRNIFDS